MAEATTVQPIAPAAAKALPVRAADDTAAAGELPGGGNIDKIRDIIFGNQMRDYEKRFLRLEERLLKEAGELRDNVKRSFEQLEGYTRHELEALTQRLKNEHDERKAAEQATTQGLRELARSNEKKLTQLDDQSIKTGRDLRQQMLEQARQLSDEIKHKFEELAVTVEREAAELRGDKTDRAALAALFTEMAMRLTNELALPTE